MSALPSSKPKLLGNDEHVVSGDVIGSITEFINPTDRSVTDITQAFGTEIIIGSETIEYTKSNNIGFLKSTVFNGGGFSNHQSTVRMRRGGLGGASLDNGTLLGGGNNNVALIGIEIDRPIGFETYVITLVEFNATVTPAIAEIYGNGFNGVGIVCNIDDTHVISGSNTQRTHESNILP